MSNTLRLTEIFYSIQGEGNTVGLPTVFVRLTGCPLRCQYCDTPYAFKGGELWEIPQILKDIHQYNTPYVTVTGGEPLAQPHCLDLLKSLCDEGYKVSLETSGAMDIVQVDKRVIKVMDLKTPGSQEEHRNRYENLDFLLPQDQVKFVICHREDYDWSKKQVSHHRLWERCEVLFSSSHEELAPHLLAEWLLADHLPVRFQVQLQKYLWGDEPGR